MGLNCNIIWYAITLFFMLLQKSCSTTTFFITMHNNNINNTSINTHINPLSLDDYLYNYSSNSISRNRRTGVLFHVSPPSNFSSIKVSIVRLRSSTIWSKGANFSTFDIPPKVIKMQHVKRFALMYENFGNMSSHYYDLPGYKILSPIIGIAVYNATDLSRNSNPERLNITNLGQPVQVRFPNHEVKLPQDQKSIDKIKCINFDPINGLIILSSIIRPKNICLTRSLGLFALAIPRNNTSTGVPVPAPASAPVLSEDRRGAKLEVWKRWLIGFTVAIMALMLLISGFIICYKTIGLMKIAKMERKTEKSESLDTRWIGTSKMPLAHVTRTQAILENDLDP